MELMFSRNWLLFSAFWITKVSSTYLSHNLGGWVAVMDGFGFKLFYEQVGHNWTDGGTHSCPIDLFINL